MVELKLKSAWEARLKLYVEGNELYIKGNMLGIKVKTRGNRLWAEDYLQYARGFELCAQAETLYAEAEKLWAEAVVSAYGDVTIEWKNWNKEFWCYECHLDNGEKYGFEKEDTI